MLQLASTDLSSEKPPIIATPGKSYGQQRAVSKSSISHASAIRYCLETNHGNGNQRCHQRRRQDVQLLDALKLKID